MRKLCYLFLIVYLLSFVFIVPAFAPVTNPPGIDLKDEGVKKGRVTALNAVGAGITATKSGSTGVLTIDVPAGEADTLDTVCDRGNTTDQTMTNTNTGAGVSYILTAANLANLGIALSSDGAGAYVLQAREGNDILSSWDFDANTATFGGGTCTALYLIANANYLSYDNIKNYFGTGADASIYYDGTNFFIDPKEVGSGTLTVLGGVVINEDGESVNTRIESNNFANLFYLEGANDRIIIGNTTSPQADYIFNVVPENIAEGSGGSGTAGYNGYLLTTGAGQNLASNFVLGATGGTGGASLLNTGAGGNAVNTGGPAYGGVAGALTIQTGTGGVPTPNVGSNSTGGNGGALSFTAGNGGAATSANGANNTGGNGGSATFIGGIGGAGNSGSGTNTGGTGGSFTFRGGRGGIGTQANGSGGDIVFDAFYDTGVNDYRTYLQIDASLQQLQLPQDSIKFMFGAGQDASIYYDATNFVINPKEVGSGYLSVLGDIISSGNIWVNETANANMTQGITINQGANDDEVLDFKSSDIAHSFTTLTETDTYAFFKKISGDNGGLYIAGYSDSNTVSGLQLDGGIGNTNPTDTVPAILLSGHKLSGTTRGALAALETVLQVKNSTTAYLTLLGSGFLGIGSSATNPLCPLHIKSARPQYILEDTGTSYCFADFWTNSTSNIFRFGLGGSTGGLVSGQGAYEAILDNWGTGGLGFFTNNLRRMTISGNANTVGIACTTPLRALDINEALGNCLRLIYNDADGSPLYYADLLVSSSGDLTINASGGDISLGDENLVTTGTVDAGTSCEANAYTVGSVAGIDSTHTVADGDGVNYHHYTFTKGLLTAYVKDTSP